MSDTAQFYDSLAESYEFLFSDWSHTVEKHGHLVDEILENVGVRPPVRIWDCTCGIGTQAIGLAMKGYTVTATDLSAKAVERAKKNLSRFEVDVSIDFGTFDLLSSLEPKSNTFKQKHEVVLALDNSIAHFHKEEEMVKAFKNMTKQVNSNGVVMISTRDYDTMACEQPRHSHVSVTDDESGSQRKIMFQVWDWDDDGKFYNSEMIDMFRESNRTCWQTRSCKARFRAWKKAEISHLLSEAGLKDIKWHDPNKTGFHQPIITAFKQT